MPHTTTHRPRARGTELPVDNMPQALDFYLRQGYEATSVDDGYAYLRHPDDEATVTLRSRHGD
jgi:hypothetical protein